MEGLLPRIPYMIREPISRDTSTVLGVVDGVAPVNTPYPVEPRTSSEA